MSRRGATPAPYLCQLRKSCFHQVALELGETGDSVHHALFSPPNNVKYDFCESVNDAGFSLRPQFEGISHREYIKWFRQNRVKRKFLPIYQEPDSGIGNYYRDQWVGFRQMLIHLLLKANLKSIDRN